MSREKIDRHNLLNNNKFLIWGLGISGGGVNVAEYFAKLGKQVRVTDLKQPDQLQEQINQLKKYPNVEFTLGKHRHSDFKWADVIVKNPAIPPTSPFLKEAYDLGKIVEMELSIFMQLFEGYTVGITGTRGKSTTTALLTDMLSAGGKKVATGGNNRLPLLSQLGTLDSDATIVIEMSSFQLHDIHCSPDCAIVTNIYPDHLDWHQTLEDYINSKTNIVRFQASSDFAILNADDKQVMSNFSNLGGGEKCLIGKSKTNQLQITKEAFYYLGKELIKTEQINIKGNHNYYNTAAASLAALKLGVSPDCVRKVLSEFNGLEYRQQLIAEKHGVKYINDSTATMPEGLIAALERFEPEGRIHLIAGGVNKGLDLTKLPKLINNTVCSVHFLAGSFTDEILPQIDTNKVHGPFMSMAEAVSSAMSEAEADDIVLLSPGAASFNLFKNEFDRGQQFSEVVQGKE